MKLWPIVCLMLWQQMSVPRFWAFDKIMVQPEEEKVNKSVVRDYHK